MKIEEIKKLDYSKIVGVLNERNRPSGGVKTIHEVCVNSFINHQSNVLEIGSNTGFATVNINLLTKAHVTGVDINPISILHATKYAERVGASVNFIKATANDLPFKDSEFDLIWASNVTSFIDDKVVAFTEYLRVLKKGGYLAIAPIYYINNPPQELLDGVSEAVGIKVDVWNKQFWIDTVKKVSASMPESALELVYSSDYTYDDKRGSLDAYIDMIFSNSDIHYPELETKELKARYKYFINLFNENLKYCGYSVLLFQKRSINDQDELFTTKKI